MNKRADLSYLFIEFPVSQWMNQFEERYNGNSYRISHFLNCLYPRDDLSFPTHIVDSYRGIDKYRLRFLKVVFFLTSSMSFVASSNSLSFEKMPANDIKSFFPSRSLAIRSLKLSLFILASRSLLYTSSLTLRSLEVMYVYLYTDADLRPSKDSLHSSFVRRKMK